MADVAHVWTDEEIEELEKRIAAEYKRAEDEVRKKMEKHFSKFYAKDKKWREDVKSGEKTREEYNKWRIGQMAVGRRWGELQSELAADLANTSKIARSITSEFTQEVYAHNYNFGTYQVEKNARIDTSFTLYSRETVERLLRDNPQLLPDPGAATSERIRLGLEQRWDEKLLQNALLQGILQGESIPHLAKRVAETVSDKCLSSAIRNARTMMTGAQNAGRIDAYHRAQGLGIDLDKKWLSAHDSRTRDWHRDLDEKIAPVDEPFQNDYGEIMYPGDPKAHPANVYNCRCTLDTVVNKVKSYSDRLKDYQAVAGMSFEQWEKDKEKEQFKHTVAYNDLMYELRAVHKNPVKDLDEALTDEEIIARLGGGDKTGGSCMSLAFAYAGAKAGWDVYDFRGGISRERICRDEVNNLFLSLDNVKGTRVARGDWMQNTKDLLNGMQKDKEYILMTARHAAIVKEYDGSLMYLELQSQYSNGWKMFSDDIETTINNRFGGKAVGQYGGAVCLISVESLGNSREFKELLQFINTNPERQKKGTGGHER